MRFSVGVFLLLLVACSFEFTNALFRKKDKVLLSEVKALTLTSNKITTGKRSAPVPQLKCVGGSASGYTDYYPSVVQCRNVGSNGYDAQWKCEADLDVGVRFGRTDVTCEGYDYPDDPYILQGSCGLEYTLDQTSRFENENSRYGHYTPARTESSGGSGFLKFVLFCVAAYIIWSIFCQIAANNAANSAQGNYPAGPGAADPRYPGGPGPHQTFNAYPSYPSAASPPPSASASAGPGFWTGLGLGGLMGGMFRRPWGGSTWGYHPQYNYGWGSGWGTGWGGSSWSFRPSTGMRSSSSFGSSTHRSTGFGTTRRR